MIQDDDGGSLSQELRKLTESFIRFSVRMDEQYKTIQSCLQKLDAQFCEIERINGEHDKTIARNTQRLDVVEGTVDELETDVEEMKPWVGGLMWAARIAGGVIVLAVVGAIIWAVIQSGVGMP